MRRSRPWWLAAGWVLAGCSPFFPAEPADDPESVFRAAWEEMDAYYGNFGARDVDWDGAWERWSPAVGPDTDDDALWAALTGMLGETDDGHVQLLAPGRERWFANTIYRERIGDERFDLGVVRSVYLDGDFDAPADDAWTWGTLRDGTPYVHLPYVASNARVLEDALDAHPDAPDIVVDLRHNSGGDFTFAFDDWGMLTDVDRPVFESRTRNGPDRDAFTGWTTWSLEPSGDRRDVRVVLLTDRFTISAGERAARALQSLPGTITLGEPTNGALATMIGRELPNRWGMGLPVQEVREPGGGPSFEAVGYPVDEGVLADPAELAVGVDAVLERALERIAESRRAVGR